jgi:hypothetical protein
MTKENSKRKGFRLAFFSVENKSQKFPGWLTGIVSLCTGGR